MSGNDNKKYILPDGSVDIEGSKRDFGLSDDNRTEEKRLRERYPGIGDITLYGLGAEADKLHPARKLFTPEGEPDTGIDRLLEDFDLSTSIIPLSEYDTPIKKKFGFDPIIEENDPKRYLEPIPEDKNLISIHLL